MTLRKTADGRTALLAYSALDRLRAGAGDQAPWSLLTVPDPQKVSQSVGDVGAAVSPGWNDIVDTGKAIGDLTVDAVGWAADGLERVGDGLSNAWGSVFG